MCICDINILFKLFAGVNFEESDENIENYSKFLEFFFGYIKEGKIVKNDILVGYLGKILL